MSLRHSVVAVGASMVLALGACGSPDSDSGSSAPATESSGDASSDVERPSVVVTTNVLGDVVGSIVGDQADVMTIMPVGADPHDFQPSAQEVDAMMSADALIVNGAGFEQGLLDVIDNARDEGVPTHEAIDAVEVMEFGESAGHDDHDRDEGTHDDGIHDEGDHERDEGTHDEHEHDHDGADPHFFTDPLRMAAAVDDIATFLSERDGIDGDALARAADAYVAELEALHDDVTTLVDAIPAERRVLVTNHEVFGYFADRYGFEVVGTVVPAGATTDSASAGELAELAEVIEAEGVPAIFADTSSSDQLVETLAAEVGDVAVVELYTESLGEQGSDGDTFLSMVRTNAQRISDALTAG